MADCYFHGHGFSGPCPECKKEFDRDYVWSREQGRFVLRTPAVSTCDVREQFRVISGKICGKTDCLRSRSRSRAVSFLNNHG